MFRGGGLGTTGRPFVPSRVSPSPFDPPCLLWLTSRRAPPLHSPDALFMCGCAPLCLPLPHAALHYCCCRTRLRRRLPRHLLPLLLLRRRRPAASPLLPSHRRRPAASPFLPPCRRRPATSPCPLLPLRWPRTRAAHTCLLLGARPNLLLLLVVPLCSTSLQPGQTDRASVMLCLARPDTICAALG